MLSKKRSIPNDSSIELDRKQSKSEFFEVMDLTQDYKNLLCDTTVHFDGDKNLINVISIPFIEKSKVFDCYLKYDKNNKLISLPNLLKTGFKEVVDFVHHGTIQITSENVYDIFLVSDYLIMNDLKELCLKYFSNASFDSKDTLSLLNSTSNLYIPELKNIAVRRILRYFDEFFNSDDFIKIEFASLKELLTKDSLNFSSEVGLMNVIEKWLKNGTSVVDSNRMPRATDLFTCIRLSNLNETQLEEVTRHPLYIELVSIQEKLEAFKLLQEISPEKPKFRTPYEIIFVLGGWFDGEGPKASVQIYNPKSDRWTMWTNPRDSHDLFMRSDEAESNPRGHQNVNIKNISRRVYAGCVIIDDILYMIGGFDSVNALKTTLAYSVEKDSWYELAKMNERRNYVSLAHLNGAIYACGGHNGNLRLNTAEKYDIKTNTWQRIESMKKVRSDASAAECMGKVYVVGGFEGQRYNASAEYYDPVTCSWTIISRMFSPRGGVCAISHNDLLYAIGGNDGKERLSTIECFNPVTKKWQVVAKMGQRKSNLSASVINDNIYIIGGWSDEPNLGILGNVEIFNTRTNELSTAKSLRYPASATCACTLRNHDLIKRFRTNLQLDDNSVQSTLNNSEFIGDYSSRETTIELGASSFSERIPDRTNRLRRRRRRQSRRSTSRVNYQRLDRDHSDYLD